MRWYVIIKIKVLCPRSGSHRKVKQNDNLCPVQDPGFLAVLNAARCPKAGVQDRIVGCDHTQRESTWLWVSKKVNKCIWLLNRAIY